MPFLYLTGMGYLNLYMPIRVYFSMYCFSQIVVLIGDRNTSMKLRMTFLWKHWCWLWKCQMLSLWQDWYCDYQIVALYWWQNWFGVKEDEWGGNWGCYDNEHVWVPDKLISLIWRILGIPWDKWMLWFEDNGFLW